MKHQIIVLMATFNGERFLDEQIKSILHQRDISLFIWVRDDGSTDSTLEILDKWKQTGLLDWYQGDSVGPARSFMHLLQTAPQAAYYAFADQDDYWLQEKLFTAIEKLSSTGNKCPALYFSQTKLVDQQLNELPTRPLKLKLTYAESLIYQFIGGNTMVFNHALRDVVIQYSPCYLSMHDVWIYTIAQSIGAYIYFDSHSHILYRQHGSNAVGNKLTVWTDWKRRFKRIIQKKEHSRFNIACELKKGYYTFMSHDNRQLTDEVMAYRSSMKCWWRLLTDNRFVCGDKKTNIFFRIAVFMRSL